MLDDLFINVLNTSITASWLILAIVIIRPLIKKAPKWICPALWALVAVRLICPFSIESVFSLVPSGETIPLDITMEQNPQIDTGISSINAVFNPVIADAFTPDQIASANPLQIVSFVLSIVWVMGIVALLLYAVISYARLKMSVKASVSIGKNILACDEVKSPFILGLIKPMIYVPSSMDGDTLKYVLSHENAHIKRRDYLWKPLGYLILTVYWFNPLCWVAYILLCKDIELACDEKVIRDMDDSGKAAYSQALLNCSFSRKTIAACPVAFGEVGVKTRVKSVLNYKKPAFWIVILSVVVIVIIAVCFMTNPKTANDVDMDESTYLINTDNFTLTEEAKSEAYMQYLSSTVMKTFREFDGVNDVKALVEYDEIKEKYNIKLNLKTDKDLSMEEIQKYGDYLSQTFYNIEIVANGKVRFTSENYAPGESGESTYYIPDVIYNGRKLMVNNRLYYESNEPGGPMGDSDCIEGKILSTVEWDEIPTENGQSNFGSVGAPYTFDYGNNAIQVFVNEDKSYHWFYSVTDYVESYGHYDYVIEGDMVFQHKLTLNGQGHPSEYATQYVVLTNNPEVTWSQIDEEFTSADKIQSMVLPSGAVVVSRKYFIPQEVDVDTIDGVQISMTQCNNGGGNLEIKNEYKSDLEIRPQFFVQKKENGKWYTLGQNNSVAQEDYVCWALSGKTTTIATDWTKMYGTLSPGEYRIVKEIVDWRVKGWKGTREVYYLATEFEITSSD